MEMMIVDAKKDTNGCLGIILMNVEGQIAWQILTAMELKMETVAAHATMDIFGTMFVN